MWKKLYGKKNSKINLKNVYELNIFQKYTQKLYAYGKVTNYIQNYIRKLYSEFVHLYVEPALKNYMQKLNI